MYVRCTDAMSDDRNPFILPDTKPSPRRGCPQCGGFDFSGDMYSGIAKFKCRICGKDWMGGTGMQPADPTVPMPPQNPKDRPTIDFTKTKNSGDMPVPFLSKSPDLTQDFRKGAPVPSGEDDV